MFPRLAIHTGNTVVTTNKHDEWRGTIVIQHNETTATILKYGCNMTSAAKRRHPLLSTFQSKCRSNYWKPCNTTNGEELGLLFRERIENGNVLNSNVGAEVTVTSADEF